MTIGKLRDDDGYRGLVRNPDTGQVLYAGEALACDPFFERIDSADQKPAVKASKAVAPAESIETPEVSAEPEVEATPEEEVSTDGDDGEFALVSIEAEVASTKDKGALKKIGEGLGVKLTKAMNVATMKDRIATQVDLIRATSEGE